MFRRGKVFIFDRLFTCACFTTCLKLWMDLWNRSQFQCLSWELSQGLVTWSETQSCREWKISRTSAMNTQTHWNTKWKRHKHVQTNKSTQALVNFHFVLVTCLHLAPILFLLTCSEGKHSNSTTMLLWCKHSKFINTCIQNLTWDYEKHF